jgi:hypothetical protein
MTDIFSGNAIAPTSPASGAFDITPHNDNELSFITRAVYVGTGGDLAVELIGGGTVTFRKLPDAALLPIRARKVLTSSTASAIIGLY